MSALLEQGYRNKWQRDEIDERIWSIWTEPKVGHARRVLEHRACVPIADYLNVWGSLQLVSGVSSGDESGEYPLGSHLPSRRTDSAIRPLALFPHNK